MSLIDLPNDVKRIISTLEGAGHEAYAVGGCVRDYLMGKTPDDWDITTSAPPQEVKALFRRTIDTGLKHGTVTVRLSGKSYEVTTFRTESDYSDGRHPDSVSFTSSLTEDLKRRDFTINAMAYNPGPDKGIIDIFGGREDLKRGFIRCVGDPDERFSEDSLRMLRAIRFSARFDFQIERKTAAAIKRNAAGLSRVSAERITAEFEKLILSGHPERLREAHELSILGIFFPELDLLFSAEQNTKHHMYTVGEHTLRVVCGVPADRVLRLAAVFHDIAKPVCRKTDKDGIDHFVGHPALGAEMARKIMRRMKFDNAAIDGVTRLVKYHDNRYEVTERNVRREISRVGASYYPSLLMLRKADVLAQSTYMAEEKLQIIRDERRFFDSIMEKQDALSISDLAIRGGELVTAGMEKGPGIGIVMKTLLKEVVDDPSLNERDILMKEAFRIYEEIRS